MISRNKAAKQLANKPAIAMTANQRERLEQFYNE